MAEFSRSSAKRLERALSDIAQLTQGRLPAGSLSIAGRQENVDRAATLMMELYGDRALDQALRIEQGSVQPAFARAVRERIEALSSN
jgi:hypothetical protein